MQKLKCVWNKQTLTKLLQNFKKWLQQSSVIKSNFKPYWILANIFDMPTNRPKFAIVVQQYFLLQRINNDGSLFYAQSTTGVGNIRPAGQIWPTKQTFLVRDVLFS